MYYTPAVSIPGIVAHRTEREALEYAFLMKTYVYHKDEPRIFVHDFRPEECFGCRSKQSEDDGRVFMEGKF